MQRRTIVTARFAGIVAEKWHHDGDFVRGGSDDPVIKIIDPTRTQVSVTLSQAELLRVSAGRPAMIRTPTGEEAPGMVSTRPAMPDPAAPTADVRVSFQTPSPLPLETPVQVVIELDMRPGATVIPRAALQRDEESAFVYIAGDDGRAHRRAVQTGLLTSDLAQVMTGVTPGESVIVTGLDQLADGAAITINR
jgi:RND family efflux transporter MFP subunit